MMIIMLVMANDNNDTNSYHFQFQIFICGGIIPFNVQNKKHCFTLIEVLNNFCLLQIYYCLSL